MTATALPAHIFSDLTQLMGSLFVSAKPFIILIAGLLLVLVILRLVRIQRRDSQNVFENTGNWFRSLMTPGNREAMLNEVICETCKKGRGLLNPVYFTRNGESFVEGSCNCCGTFLRVRLRS